MTLTTTQRVTAVCDTCENPILRAPRPTYDTSGWSDDGWGDDRDFQCFGESGRHQPAKPTPTCTCVRHDDGSVTRFLCSVHADTDPCLTMSHVTGRRRTGTIRRGVCTACGHGATP